MTTTVTQETIFNGALTRHLGQRALTTAEISGNTVEAARVLNAIWDDSFIIDCLEDSYWTFATRTSMFDFSPSVQPEFGYLYSYNIPEDHIRLCGFWSDDRQNVPIIKYAEEAGYWFTDFQTVFISYISSSPEYGLDMSRWPPAFCRWIECYLALQACYRITADAALEQRLEKRNKQLRTEARSKNAMQKPTSFPATGSWVISRQNGWGTRRGRW